MNNLIKQNPHWYIEHLMQRVEKLEQEIQDLKTNKRKPSARKKAERKRTPENRVDSELPKVR